MPPLIMNRRRFLESSTAAVAAVAAPAAWGGQPVRSPDRAGRHEDAPLQTYFDIRGFNYVPSTARNDIEFWRDYDEARVESELDLARRLGLNAARPFLHHVVYENDRSGFLKRVRHFVRTAHERGIATMPVVWDMCFSEVVPSIDMDVDDWVPNPGVHRLGRDFWPAGERFCEDLVQTLGPEPGLLLWDIMNEPMQNSFVWTKRPEQDANKEIVWTFVRHFCEVMARLDRMHARTVGNDYASNTAPIADHVDVVSFHDYSPNRARLRAHFEEGLGWGQRLAKPVIVSEIGCLARTNPYDMTLEACRDFELGWFLWELMIGVSRWNDIHGIVYPDGTVRDPSIVAAVQGFFRRRGPGRIRPNLDKEGAVTRLLKNAGSWLEDSAAPLERGLTLLEEAANLLEAGEAVAMCELPTIRAMELAAAGPEGRGDIRTLLTEWMRILQSRRSGL